MPSMYNQLYRVGVTSYEPLAAMQELQRRHISVAYRIHLALKT
jgi:hypothetical protein